MSKGISICALFGLSPSMYRAHSRKTYIVQYLRRTFFVPSPMRLGLNGLVSDRPKMVTWSRLATPRFIASLICQKRHTNRLATLQTCKWKNFGLDGPIYRQTWVIRIATDRRKIRITQTFVQLRLSLFGPCKKAFGRFFQLFSHI